MDLMTMLLACSLATDNSITQAIVELGSQNKPLMVSVVGGETKTFTTEAAATAFSNSELQQGHSIKLGLMQIPSRWLEPYHLTLSDIFKPCKNMVIATRIVNEMHNECFSIKRSPPVTDMQACALSMYETGDPQQGLDYANKIIAQAKAHPYVTPDLTLGHPSSPPKTAGQPNNSMDIALKPTTTDDQNAQR